MKRFLRSRTAALLSAWVRSRWDNVPVEINRDPLWVPVSWLGCGCCWVGKGGGRQDLGKSTQDMSMQSASRLVYFYDSFAIRPEFQSMIDSHARFIKPPRIEGCH